ncbi:MAG: hypothetical protein H7099_04405 [Gemmatimonadaceae bacterium]|nr:hypothetical protein [Gemmatimonadaceae bacterium]
MIAGLMNAALLAGALVTAAPAAAPAARVHHDFHVSYTRMAIEGTSISAQIRVFGDDVTKALVERTKVPALTPGSAAGQAAFQKYLVESFPVTANGRVLVPVVASATAEREMWSYIVTWTATAPITAISMHNSAMMELFDDQQNIVKIKHIGSGKESTLFYAGGSRVDQVVRF